MQLERSPNKTVKDSEGGESENSKIPLKPFKFPRLLKGQAEQKKKRFFKLASRIFWANVTFSKFSPSSSIFIKAILRLMNFYSTESVSSLLKEIFSAIKFGEISLSSLLQNIKQFFVG